MAPEKVIMGSGLLKREVSDFAVDKGGEGSDTVQRSAGQKGLRDPLL